MDSGFEMPLDKQQELHEAEANAILANEGYSDLAKQTALATPPTPTGEGPYTPDAMANSPLIKAVEQTSGEPIGPEQLAAVNKSANAKWNQFRAEGMSEEDADTATGAYLDDLMRKGLGNHAYQMLMLANQQESLRRQKQIVQQAYITASNGPERSGEGKFN
jgi:hypothetical protein